MQSRAVFQHSPARWTVGDLQRALVDVDPESELVIFVAEKPGRESWEEQVVVGLWEAESPEAPGVIAVILADLPAGLYLKEPDDTS